MQVFCDFDGTITSRDSIVFLTEEFGAGPSFRFAVLEAIKTGEISVFEAIEQELATVKATWEEAVEALRTKVAMTAGFPLFVQWCRDRQLPLTVLSSGMAPVVGLYLEPLGVPFLAHDVVPSRDGWAYTMNPENEKPAVLKAARETGSIVFIGDGTSDVSALPFADQVFARRGYYLGEYCSHNGIPFHPFEDFDDVRVQMESILALGE